MHSDHGDHSFYTQIPVDYFLAANSGLILPPHILIQGWGVVRHGLSSPLVFKPSKHDGNGFGATAIFLRMFQCCTPLAIHDQDILNSESTAIDELSIRYSFSMHSDCGDHSFCTQIPVDYFLAANNGSTLPSHILIQGWGL